MGLMVRLWAPLKLSNCVFASLPCPGHGPQPALCKTEMHEVEGQAGVRRRAEHSKSWKRQVGSYQCIPDQSCPGCPHPIQASGCHWSGPAREQRLSDCGRRTSPPLLGSRPSPFQDPSPRDTSPPIAPGEAGTSVGRAHEFIAVLSLSVYTD